VATEGDYKINGKQASSDKRVRYRIFVASYCEQKPPTDPRISNRGSLFGKRGSVRVGSAQLFSRKTDSPLPFPDSGIVLMWISISQINVTQSRPLARMKGKGVFSSLRYKSRQDYYC